MVLWTDVLWLMHLLAHGPDDRWQMTDRIKAYVIVKAADVVRNKIDTALVTKLWVQASESYSDHFGYDLSYILVKFTTASVAMDW